jgi:hypothetical protein
MDHSWFSPRPSAGDLDRGERAAPTKEHGLEGGQALEEGEVVGEN